MKTINDAIIHLEPASKKGTHKSPLSISNQDLIVQTTSKDIQQYKEKRQENDDHDAKADRIDGQSSA